MDYQGQQEQDDSVYGGELPHSDFDLSAVAEAVAASGGDDSEAKVSAKRKRTTGMKQSRGRRQMYAPCSYGLKSKNKYKETGDGRQCFLLELEFVQCLANPTYIHYMAQNRYFEDEAFIGYLKYLQYWPRPEYIKFKNID